MKHIRMILSVLLALTLTVGVMAACDRGQTADTTPDGTSADVTEALSSHSDNDVTRNNIKKTRVVGDTLLFSRYFLISKHRMNGGVKQA